MANFFSSRALRTSYGLNPEVDPKTGQILYSIHIASIIGNYHMGPDFSLTLYYRADQPDGQFGKRFYANLTQFNIKTKALTMRDGRIYYAKRGSDTGSKPGEVIDYTFIHDNPKDFVFTEVDNIWLICHKDGTVEELSGSGDIKYIRKLFSPLGHELKFKWVNKNNLYCLESISDSNGKLLNVSGSGNAINFSTNSRAQKYDVTLNFENRRIIEVVRIASEKNLFQSIEYCDNKNSPYYNERKDVDIDAIWRITNIYGTYDTFEYQFPGMKSYRGENGPCIKKHTHSEMVNNKKETWIKEYVYSGTNYLGGQGWSSQLPQENEDSLYNISVTNDHVEYVYTSTESYEIIFPGENGQATRKYETKRTYNHFHLLTTEDLKIDEIAQDTKKIINSAKESKAFHYNYRYDLKYEGQPENFDKVLKIDTRYTHSIDSEKSVITEEYTYDVQGNITSIIDSSGKYQRITYYPPEGKPGACPEDPHKFIKHISSVSTNARTISYTYAYLERIKDNNANAIAVVCAWEIYEDNDDITHQIFHVYGNNKKSFDYGRKISESVSYTNAERNPVKLREFTWGKEIADGLELVVCNEKYDGRSETPIHKTKVWTVPDYHLVYEIDSDENKRKYSYDSHGRLTLVEFNAEHNASIYKRSIFYRYKQVGSKIYVNCGTHSDFLVKTTCYDPSGYVAEEWFKCESIIEPKILYRCLRNIAGKKIREERFDYTPEGKQLCKEVKDYFYNIWGHVEKIRHGNGLVQYFNCDPISERISSYLSYLSTDKKIIKSASRFVQFSDARISVYGRELESEKKDKARNKELYNSSVASYDKHGRVISLASTDEVKPLTITYDSDGRVAERSTPYGSVVRFSKVDGYKNPSSIEIYSGKEWVEIMDCRYDNWGRIISSGGNKYKYEGSELSSLSSNGIELLKFKYSASLKKVSQMSIIPTNVDRDYFYDSSGLITSIVESDGVVNDKTYEFTYDEFYNLKNETSNYGESITNASFLHSVCGRILRKDDAAGNIINYSYNDEGLVSEIDYGDVSIIIDYNFYGLMSRKKISVPGSDNFIMQDYLYDDFGRCINVAVSLNTGKVIKRSIDYKYDKIDRLVSRDFASDKMAIRNESYSYDDNGRLQAYLCIGDKSTSESGHKIASQHAVWDVLGRLTDFKEMTGSGVKINRVFSYNSKHPFRISSILETIGIVGHGRSVIYDDHGRVTNDGFGYTYTYDILGRIASAHSDKEGTANYHYDSRDRIIKIVGKDDVINYVYQGGVLTEIITKDKIITYFDYRSGYKLYNKRTRKSKYFIRAVDTRGDTLFNIDTGNPDLALIDYLPWRDTIEWGGFNPLFSNEFYDKYSDCYICGYGTRFYNSRIKQFLTPDILKPLKGNFINSYSYCNGDPVNLHDPSGTLSFNAWGNILIGLASIASIVLTEGAATGLVGIAIRNLTLLSGTTGYASGTLEQADPQLSSKLQMASAGFGVAAIGAGVANYSYHALKTSYAIERTIYQIPDPETGNFTVQNRSALYTNFMDKGIMAYQTHSFSRIPTLMSFSGKVVSAEQAATEEILPLLRRAARDGFEFAHPDTPLLLVACSAGKSGAAREVANVIRRPVASYLKTIWSYDFFKAEKFMAAPYTVGNYPHYQSTAWYTKTLNWLSGTPNCIIAPYHIYYPDDFFDGSHDMNAILDFNRRFYGN